MEQRNDVVNSVISFYVNIYVAVLMDEKCLKRH